MRGSTVLFFAVYCIVTGMLQVCRVAITGVNNWCEFHTFDSYWCLSSVHIAGQKSIIAGCRWFIVALDLCPTY